MAAVLPSEVDIEHIIQNPPSHIIITLPTNLRIKVKIKHIDVQIQRILIRLFNQNFEMMKIHSTNNIQTKKEIQINQSEAINIIWRYTALSLGQMIPFLNQTFNPQQLIIEFSNLNIQQDNIEKTPEKELLIRQAQELEQQIKQLILNKQFSNELKEFLQSVILQKQKGLFLSTLIGVKQITYEKLEFVFQQSYPSLILTRSQAIEILGPEQLQMKIKLYLSYQQKKLDQQKKQIQICHNCLKPNLFKYYKCQNDNAANNVSGSLEDPYLYRAKLMSQNLFISEFYQTKSYIHPFSKYFRPNKTRKYVCNRIFCEKCQSIHRKIDFKMGLICTYCLGICNCFRCKAIEQLIKLIGIYLYYGGNFSELSKKFRFNLSDSMKLNFQLQKTKPLMTRKEFNKIVEDFVKIKIFEPGIHQKPQIIYEFPINFIPGNKNIKKKKMLRQVQLEPSKLDRVSKKARKIKKIEQKGSQKDSFRGQEQEANQISQQSQAKRIPGQIFYEDDSMQ